jgi:hypothetical protein
MALELITGLGENTHAICEAIARQLSAELGETVTWNNASTWDELQARLSAWGRSNGLDLRIIVYHAETRRELSTIVCAPLRYPNATDLLR